MPIKIVDQEKISVLTALDATINVLSEKVKVCIQEQKFPVKKCFCKYPKAYSAFKREHTIALKKYPEWKNQTVYYGLTEKKQTITINFAGLGRQLRLSCD